jgi:hypothetical protein
MRNNHFKPTSFISPKEIAMKTRLSTAVAFLALSALAMIAHAQEPDVIPQPMVPLELGNLGLIDDLQISEMGATTSFSFTNENGIKTTKVVDGHNRMTIVEDPTSGITCKVTKTYSSDDLAKLEEEQPELFMHLSSIPKSVGESEIEISVGVTSTYAAADVEELKSKHPEVYKLYNKYTKDQGLGRIHMRMGRPMRLPLLLEGGRFGFRADDDDESADDDDGDEDDDEDEEDDGDEDDDDGDEDGDEDDDDDRR